jgi:hypothetical protein
VKRTKRWHSAEDPTSWCLCGYVGDEFGEDFCTKCGEVFDGTDPDHPAATPTPGGNICAHCGNPEYESACPKCGSVDAFGFWDTGPLEARPRLRRDKKAD